MKTIAILIQAESDKDLQNIANDIGRHVDVFLEEKRLLDSWRTPFTMIMSCGLTMAIRRLADLETNEQSNIER